MPLTNSVRLTARTGSTLIDTNFSTEPQRQARNSATVPGNLELRMLRTKAFYTRSIRNVQLCRNKPTAPNERHAQGREMIDDDQRPNSGNRTKEPNLTSRTIHDGDSTI